MPSHVNTSMNNRIAACACGQLVAKCSGAPASVSLCYCLQCQRRTGSSFGLAAFFDRGAVEIEGSATSFLRSSEAGAEVMFHFCGTCGSTVYWEPRRKPEVLAVAVGCFADPGFPPPSKYVYGEHRHPWVSAAGRSEMTHSSGSWAIEDDPSAADLAIVSEGVTRFGRAEAVGGNPRPIACFLRDSGKVIAGATGRTEFNRLFVSYLWVSEELRGQGLGSQALAMIEDAARARGSRDALIETLNDRNADLYQHLGYVLVASIQRYVGKFTKYVLVKDLRGIVS
jgi:hypothetical protein